MLGYVGSFFGSSCKPLETGFEGSFTSSFKGVWDDTRQV